MSTRKRSHTRYNFQELTETGNPSTSTTPTLNYQPPRNNFLSLPNEMKEKIYSFLPQGAALSLREVSEDIKEGIDTFYYFNVKYDDQNGRMFLETIKTLRIKELKVINFQRPPPSTPAFKYPQYIRTLSIVFNKQISPEGFNYIMNQCGQYLKTVDFKITDDLLTYANSNYGLFRYNLSNLTHLKISTKKCKSLHLSDSDDNRANRLVKDLLLKILNNCQESPCKLTTFDVKLGFYGTAIDPLNEMAFAIFSLISKYRSTLTNLSISVQGVILPVDDEFVNLRVETFNFDNFDSLKVVHFKVYGFQESSFCRLSTMILRQQSHLADLSLVSCSQFNRNFGIRELISNNAPTLKLVTLFLHQEVDDCLDFSIFENCQNLKTLIVVVDPIFTLTTLEEISNMMLLPSSLEHLEIRSFIINREDIKNFLSRGDLTCLSVLVLDKCNLFRKADRKCPLLKKIFKLPNIDKISIQELNGPIMDCIGFRS